MEGILKTLILTAVLVLFVLIALAAIWVNGKIEEEERRK